MNHMQMISMTAKTVGVVFYSQQLLFGIDHHHNNVHSLASWLCDCKIALCEKYP